VSEVAPFNSPFCNCCSVCILCCKIKKQVATGEKDKKFNSYLIEGILNGGFGMSN
jgi:hypothetical protein